MFNTASNQHEALKDQIQNQLIDKLNHLDKTATNWYDATSKSASTRMQLVNAAAITAREAAANTDDEVNAAELHDLSSDLDRQASQLRQLANELKAEELESNTGDGNLRSPYFSSRGLSDESHITGSVRQTDWDLFLSVEPREFVASNEFVINDAEEIRTRAYNFIATATSGHGLSRKAKIELVETFLSNVEWERQAGKPKIAKTASKNAISYPDTALFI
jgi:hypothetical protein